MPKPQPVVKLDQRISPSAVMRHCLDKAGGDSNRAEALFRKRLDNNRTLLQNFLTEMIHQYVLIAASNARTAIARAALSPPNPDDASGLHSLAESNFNDLFDTPLRNGLRLGDATPDDLRLEIDTRYGQANGLLRNAKFYELILARMGTHKKVRNAMTPETLALLRQQADGLPDIGA